MEEQNHPLHAVDRRQVDRLLAATTPGDDELIHAARLLMRYEAFPGASDLRRDLERLLTLWGLDRQELHRRTRVLWASGHRPGLSGAAEAVGSGFDTADGDGA